MRLFARLMSALLFATVLMPSLIAAPVAASGNTDHFAITGLAASEVAGVADTFTVTAKDASDVTDPTFAGTVSFTSSDGAAVLPADGQTLTSGTDTFSVTFKTSGPQDITVTEDGDTPTGSASTGVVAADADHLVLGTYPSPVAAGDPHSVSVTARDEFGNTDTNWGGDVTVDATGGTTHVSPASPIGLTNGARSFSVTFDNSGSSHTITVTGTLGVAGDGQSGIVVNPAPADHLVINPSYPVSTAAGAPHSVVVTAKDPFGNTTPAYAGLVAVSATGGVTHISPAGAVALTSGSRSFSVTFDTAGSGRTVSTFGTAGVDPDSQTGITVTPGAATHLVLGTYPDPTTAGVAHDVTVTATDGFGNTDPTYAGDVTVSASGGATAVTPGGPTGLGGGVGTFSVEFDTAGAGRSITATGTLGVASDTQTLIDVTAASADHLVATTYPASTVAGVAHTVTVTALDQFGNTDKNYAGDVTVTASGGTTHVVPAGPTGLTNGVGTFDVTFDTVGSGRSVNASGTGGVASDGTSGIDVTVGLLDHIVISPSTATHPAGVAQSYITEAFDAFGNTRGDVTGTTTFTVDGHPCAAADCSAFTVGDHVVQGAFSGKTDTATLTITNTGPVANDDSPAPILEDAGPTIFDVLANDTDVNLDTLVVTNVSQGAQGTVAIGTVPGDGANVTYTPDPDANGTDSFTYQISDGHGGTSTAMVNVTITAVNDAPSFTVPATAPSIPEQSGIAPQTVPGFATGMSAGPTDEAAQVLSFSISNGGPTLFSTQPAVDVTTGNLTYTPAVNRAGTVTVSLTLHDTGGTANGGVASVVHTFTITVIGSNHAPIAINDSFTVVSGSPATALPVLVNDNAANPDVNEVLRITNVTKGTSGGTVTITGGGTGLTYRPKSGFIGTDFFKYRIKDASLFSAYATVRVVVPRDTYKPVATAPVQTIGGQSIGTSTVVVHLAWTGTDKGYGISKFELWQSVNGHSFTKIKTTSGHSASVTTKVNSTYRFRVRAIDRKKNVGAFAYGPAFKVVLSQEYTATYPSGMWAALTGAVFSGGHARTTTTPGFDASFTSTGRTFTWIAVRGPARGTADVYVDGVLRAHLSLTSSTTIYRYAIWTVNFPTSAAHTLRIVYTGLSTKRVDVDAFVVLR